MKNITTLLNNFWNDESGISSVEYALLLAFVAGGIIVAADVLSQAVQGEMTEAADCISATDAATAGC